MTQYDLLFSQVKIGTLTLKNRFAMAPMGPLGLGDAQGALTRGGSTTTLPGRKVALG